MKTDILKLSLLIFLCQFLSPAIHAQSYNYFVIKGLVLSDTKSADSCFILISGKTGKVLKAPVDGSGRFRLELKYNSEYKLVFQKSQHNAKTIVVNTSLPAIETNQKGNTPYFLMAVRLKSGNEVLSPEKIQYIGYSSITGGFVRLVGKPDNDYADKNVNMAGANFSQYKGLEVPNYLLF